jgi:Fe-S-cluster-containing hydrogenase component 2
MSTDDDFRQHFVCTLDEARSIVDEHKKYWIADCGCRKLHASCKRSRTDVCLQLAANTVIGSHEKTLTKDEVIALLEEARERRLVPRPFRNEKDREKLDGICFCCDDCCSYFNGFDGLCDKGKQIEQTYLTSCTDCGVCTGVCYFGARNMDSEVLKIDREKCYGCGICADVCDMKVITMVPR